MTVNTTNGNGVFIFDYGETYYAVPRFYKNENAEFTLEHVETDANSVTAVVAYVFADNFYFCSIGFDLTSAGLIQVHPGIGSPRGI